MLTKEWIEKFSPAYNPRTGRFRDPNVLRYMIQHGKAPTDYSRIYFL